MITSFVLHMLFLFLIGISRDRTIDKKLMCIQIYNIEIKLGLDYWLKRLDNTNL